MTGRLALTRFALAVLVGAISVVVIGWQGLVGLACMVAGCG